MKKTFVQKRKFIFFLKKVSHLHLHLYIIIKSGWPSKFSILVQKSLIICFVISIVSSNLAQAIKTSYHSKSVQGQGMLSSLKVPLFYFIEWQTNVSICLQLYYTQKCKDTQEKGSQPIMYTLDSNVLFLTFLTAMLKM